MQRHLRLRVLALSFVLSATSNFLAQEDHSATFTTIDFPGATKTLALDINPRGDIVGSYDLANPAGPDHGYLLSGGEFTTIDFPGAVATSANGINPRGDIVGRYDTADKVSHGFLLSGGEFTSIDFPDATLTTANGITPGGDIVGRYTLGGVTHGYLLSEGQ